MAEAAQTAVRAGLGNSQEPASGWWREDEEVVYRGAYGPDPPPLSTIPLTTVAASGGPLADQAGSRRRNVLWEWGREEGSFRPGPERTRGVAAILAGRANAELEMGLVEKEAWETAERRRQNRKRKVRRKSVWARYAEQYRLYGVSRGPGDEVCNGPGSDGAKNAYKRD